MNIKQILGLIAIVAGVVLIFVGRYIDGEVAAGNLQISVAQHKVDTANKLFSQSDYTKQIGKGFTSGAQSKIDAGQDEVNYYTVVANRCKFGGIALIIVGAGTMFFFRRKKR